jgi:SAM-dependent methyltransferase
MEQNDMINRLKNSIRNKIRSLVGYNELVSAISHNNLQTNKIHKPILKNDNQNFFVNIQNDCQILRQDTSLLTSPNLELMLQHNSEIANSHYLSVHKKRLIYTFSLLEALEFNPDGNYLVDMGSWIPCLPVIKNIFPKLSILLLVSNDLEGQSDTINYSNVMFDSIDLESEKIPLPDNSASLVLLLEVIEHFGHDPMFVMSEVNRVLVEGGKVIISTPNLASWRSLVAALTHYSPYTYGKYLPGVPHGRHIHEYVPRDVSILLQSSGFQASVWTENVYHTDSSPQLMTLLEELHLPTEDRGDTIFAVGTKVKSVQERYPIDLYDV